MGLVGWEMQCIKCPVKGYYHLHYDGCHQYECDNVNCKERQSDEQLEEQRQMWRSKRDNGTLKLLDEKGNQIYFIWIDEIN